MELKGVNPLSSSKGRRFMSIVLAISMGGAGYHFKKTYDPGELSATSRNQEPLGGYHSHADFEKECKHCHAPIHCVEATRCQECHIEIARQQADGEGLHGILPNTGKCSRCHVEHQGRTAVISRFPLANVDHGRLTGYSLAGHQERYDGEPMACADCHTQHRFSLDAVDCVSCHEKADPPFMGEHLTLYGNQCVACHDGVDRMAGFDHELVFPLREGHAVEDCEACHADFVFADPARDCIACHEEPKVHAGEFGLDCSRCHTATNWTQTELTRHTFRLDHGGEGEVACETCHTESYVTHTCYECHDHTPEGMQEAHALEGITDLEGCAACHPTGEPGEGALHRQLDGASMYERQG
jgi:hypothetical protein